MKKNQKQTLFKTFQEKPYLDKKEKRQLARLLNVSERRIQLWYSNRRKDIRYEEFLTGTGEEWSAKYAISVSYIFYRGVYINMHNIM